MAGVRGLQELFEVAGLLEACAAAIAIRARGGSAWAGLIDRGMAVDFDWTTGSAPRYVDAYRRAIAIRRGASGANCHR